MKRAVLARCKLWWESYAFRFIGGSIFLLGVLPTALHRVGVIKDYSLGVIVGTGVAIVWYTVETFCLRREMVRQNELAVQPVIIAVIREKATQGPHIVLRNIGRGPALYIHMPEMKLSDAAGDQVTFAARFESISYLEPAQEIPVRSSCSAIDGDTPGG
jgi:hypothetical protein